jgi:hypothetical protein
VAAGVYFVADGLVEVEVGQDLSGFSVLVV